MTILEVIEREMVRRGELGNPAALRNLATLLRMAAAAVDMAAKSSVHKGQMAFRRLHQENRHPRGGGPRVSVHRTPPPLTASSGRR